MSISRSAYLLPRLLFIHTSGQVLSRTRISRIMAMSASEGDVYVGTTERGLTQELQFPVPWGNIAGKAWGDPLGRPVLGLHGYLDNANTFDTLAPLLPKDLYFVSLDLSGHGHSSHFPLGMTYKYENYLMDVHRVVQGRFSFIVWLLVFLHQKLTLLLEQLQDMIMETVSNVIDRKDIKSYFVFMLILCSFSALAWKKFSFIAHSLGGSIAIMYSAVFPASVERLTLLDISGPFYHPLEGTVERLADSVHRKLHVEKTSQLPPHVYSREVALNKLLQGNEWVTRKSGAVLLERGTREVEGGLVYTRDLNLKNLGFFSLTPEQAEELVKGVKCPVLMLSATERLAPPEYDRERSQMFLPLFKANSSQFTELQIEGNHHVHLNNPERVAPHISAFFTPDTPTQPQTESKL
ncbi:serine hydrolase-like protein [Branchiostoma lanceolatum]|uniref:serine hydrolase-like protein n=1 Tax=Branchiostoma lanceolatum TaxID=7740 RepID=UPI003453E961